MLDSPLSTNMHLELFGFSVVVVVVVVAPVEPIVSLLHVLSGVVSTLDSSVLYTSAANVDELSDDSVPPEGADADPSDGRDTGGCGSDTAAGDRDGPIAPADGNFGGCTGGLTPPTGSCGVVTLGGLTGELGTVTGADGVVAFGVAFVIPRGPLHFVFHVASAWLSRLSKPKGTASVFVPFAPGPLKLFEGSEASAFARLLSAAEAAYGPPWLPYVASSGPPGHRASAYWGCWKLPAAAVCPTGPVSKGLAVPSANGELSTCEWAIE
jgi:hypothetical protein